MCLGEPAKAHPHVFVDARTGFIFGTDGKLEALNIQMGIAIKKYRGMGDKVCFKSF